MEFTFNGVIPKNITFNGNFVERVECNGVTVWEHEPTGKSSLKITANSTSTVSMVHDNNSSERFETPNVKYSLDNGLTWIELTFTQDSNNSEIAYSTSFTLLQGESILFKGNNPNRFNNYVLDDTSGKRYSYWNYKKFIIEGDVNVSGNVMSLIDNGACTTTTIPCAYCFYNLFSRCTGITSILSGLLPATKLSGGCYESMFRDCTSLSNVPNDLLPSLEVEASSYRSMFQRCTSLTRAPELNARYASYSAYDSMFWGCTSLSYIYCKLTTLGTSPSPTNMWVKDVSSKGIFYKLSGVTWETGVSGIPKGWTVKNI